MGIYYLSKISKICRQNWVNFHRLKPLIDKYIKSLLEWQDLIDLSIITNWCKLLRFGNVGVKKELGCEIWGKGGKKWSGKKTSKIRDLGNEKICVKPSNLQICSWALWYANGILERNIQFYVPKVFLYLKFRFYLFLSLFSFW